LRCWRYSFQLGHLQLAHPHPEEPRSGVTRDGPRTSWLEMRYALLTMRKRDSPMRGFFGHFIKRWMPIDLGLRRLEHHALLGGIGRDDRARRHHPDREAFAAAGGG